MFLLQQQYGENVNSNHLHSRKKQQGRSNDIDTLRNCLTGILNRYFDFKEVKILQYL